MNVANAVEHLPGDGVPVPATQTSADPAAQAPEAYPVDGEAPSAYPVDGGPPPAYPVYYVPEPNRFTRFFLALHERSPRWAAPAAIAVCFAGAASWVWVMNPTDTGANYASTCIIKMTTGLDCPGCGGTRAFFYLMHGNLPDAVRHHLMAVFAAPFLIWLYVAWTVRHISGRRIPAPRISAKAISIYLAAWMVFMVARNLPWAPFTSLFV
jgi:hypothetical protein